MEMSSEKNIFLNSIYSICYKVMNVLFPLIISVYSSHILLAEGVGTVALAQNIVMYFVNIAQLGIPNYGTKMIGGLQYNEAEKRQVFTELFIINLISTVVCSCAFFALFFSSDYFYNNKHYLIFSSLIVLNVINVDWFYQGIEEYKYIAIRSVIVKLVCLISLPIFVKTVDDTYQYAIILCTATVGNYFFNIVHLHKNVKFSFVHLNLRRHLGKVFILLASVCSTEIYTMLDSTMVGTICSETELGYYVNSVKTVRMSYVLITAACAVYLPRLSLYFKGKHKENFNALASQGMKLVLFFSIPIFAGIEILADYIIPVLFGVAFEPAVVTLRLLGGLVIVFSVAYIGGHVILIASDREKYTMFAAMAGAVVNFVLNMLLLKWIGFNGAAVASVIAEILVTMILLSVASKVVCYQISFKFIRDVLIATGVMSVVTFIIKGLISNMFLGLFLCIAIGALVYFIIQALLNNEFMLAVIQKLDKHIK